MYCTGETGRATWSQHPTFMVTIWIVTIFGCRFCRAQHSTARVCCRNTKSVTSSHASQSVASQFAATKLHQRGHALN
ncbi:hypothetical protein B0T12DRAFT_425646 [Alternaria alternata]|nr:hypothetical protein B0T12DRAFT_425646 [Alternaria alternata]